MKIHRPRDLGFRNALGNAAMTGLCVWCLASGAARGDAMSDGFKSPPAEARPWVYWFWNNGNVTERGIEADLSAMKEAGIGGAIIMDVLERFAPPPGDADYMSPRWRQLMVLALRRAGELGIELNVTNGPGWCGSSGPWITPELSMQALVCSTVGFEGGENALVQLPVPNLPEIPRDVFNSTVESEPWYRDIVVLAYPKHGGVKVREVMDLTKEMDASGRLRHRFPEGDWVVQRIGHASTGMSTRPPVKGGNGLECDKFSKRAVTLQFEKVIGMLAAAVPRAKSGGLVATHVDSWEVGEQSWTGDFAADFKRRRGYDPTKYLPVIVGIPDGATLGTAEEVARFRWDFDQTRSELLSENYIGTLAGLSHRAGLSFTMEGYNLPFGDEAEYTACSDEPMTEFWSTGGNENARKAHEMASVGHTTGRTVIGAEAFTASDADRWQLHPALVKPMGDYQMCQGVNRFVIHRYAMQPYPDKFPGATMGPWGLHYERTNTWWPMSGGWHQYLSRCQFMLRQGLPVADVLYLRHQRPNQTYFKQDPPLPPGYRSDDISAEQLIHRATVADGRIVLADGMSYRLLVVPKSPMTPALVSKIAELVAQGGTVYGPRPTSSPSLHNYPACDRRVNEIATQVWGEGGGGTSHSCGKGQVISGGPMEQVLQELAGGPDFAVNAGVNWIHRKAGSREIYFVANSLEIPVVADCQIRVRDLAPQWWNPETGEVRNIGRVETTGRGTRLRIPLEAGQSGFVVFAPDSMRWSPVTTVSLDGKPVGEAIRMPEVSIRSASYGPNGDAARTIDVKEVVGNLIRQGMLSFPVAKVAEPRDPAFGVVKTLCVDATVNGVARRWSGIDTDRFGLLGESDVKGCGTMVWATESPDRFVVATTSTGEFRLANSAGKEAVIRVGGPDGGLAIPGPWDVAFPPGWGAPATIRLEKLSSLSESEVEGVRHFSGICTYQTEFDYTAGNPGAPGKARYWLCLGDLEVMAIVHLNGMKVGTVWNRPARIEVTAALKPGRNELKVEVANLWQNRMIGDAALPESKRLTWSSYQPFSPDSPLPKSGLMGPVTIETVREIEVKFDP